ncbi:MAG TPA: hypothetical protein VD997_11690 [Phycisphaerales bacterium]|nr:hypothetical protein [Phycisphaerales bacterium]
MGSNGVVPNDRRQKVVFYNAHTNAWSANATAIGITSTRATAFAALVQDAIQAMNEADELREASKVATANFYKAVSTMGSEGAAIIATIRAFAESTNNEAVYGMAMLPVPGPGTPVPPPGTPSDYRVELLQDGSIVLKWKCQNPAGASGTIYEVRRRPIAGGPWTFIGATGTKSFSDDTLPSGSGGVTYQITAVRSTRRGNPGQFNVNFGVGGGGGIVATVTETTAKLAA